MRGDPPPPSPISLPAFVKVAPCATHVQVAEVLVVVQSIAHHKAVGDFKSNICREERRNEPRMLQTCRKRGDGGQFFYLQSLRPSGVVGTLFTNRLQHTNGERTGSAGSARPLLGALKPNAWLTQQPSPSWVQRSPRASAGPSWFSQCRPWPEEKREA